MLPELMGLTFGQRVKYLRNRVHFTQEQLGEQTGIDFKRIQKYEADKHRPRRKNVRLLCDALKVTEEQLVGNEMPKGSAPATAQGSESLRAVTKIAEGMRDVVERTPERCASYEATRTNALVPAELRPLLAWMDQQRIESISVMDGADNLAVLLIRRADAEPIKSPTRPAAVILGQPAEALTVTIVEAPHCTAKGRAKPHK